ncbi:hypothetical protein [uncultured Desulfuromonas sp.]|uniref:hypothetical protein n=1 Tax=uncultured Desulfuromonas sp. TaxID=181013 RepID=UPI002AAA8E19|nr:hypothetical protein [uncultured Desulfuromonas sp.]
MISVKHNKTLLIIFTILYTVIMGILLIWIKELSPETYAHVENVYLEPSGQSISLTGENLDHNFSAILASTSPEEESLVTTKFTWSEVYDIQIKENIAWAANNKKGIVAFNIDNPSSPYIVSSLELPNNPVIWRITINDNYLFTSSTKNGLYIIDISKPETPKLLSWLDLPGTTNQIVTQNNLALVAAGESGLQIVDIKNKNRPKLLSSTFPRQNLDCYFFTVCVKKNLAFISGREINSRQAVTYCIDFSDPKAPVEIGKIHHTGSKTVWDSLIIKDVLYCGTTNGITKINISEGLSSKREKFLHDFSILRLHSTENSLFVASKGQRIHRLDLKNNFNIKTFHIPRRACRCITTKKNFAFIGSGIQGITIVTLKYPDNGSQDILSLKSNLKPDEFLYSHKNNLVIFGHKKVCLAYFHPESNKYKIVREIKFKERIIETAHEKNKVFFSVLNKGIYTIRLNNGEWNIEESFLPINESIKSLKIFNNKLYICVKEKIIIADISSIKPKIINEISIKNTPNLISFRDNYAFISTTNSGHEKHIGIDIYKVSDNTFQPISNIIYPKTINQTNTSNGILFRDNILLDSGSEGLITIDISSIQKPEILDSVEFSKTCETSQIIGDIVYVNHNRGGLSFMDISNPRKIKKLGYLQSNRKSKIVNNKIYSFDSIGNMSCAPAPVALPQKSVGHSSLTLDLPKDIQSGSYDLFFSNEKRYIRIKKALTLTGNKKWILNAINIKKAYAFSETI